MFIVYINCVYGAPSHSDQVTLLYLFSKTVWTPIEVFQYTDSVQRQAYLGDAKNEDGHGQYIIVPDADAKVQNTRVYACMVSRVGVSEKVGFRVIGKL